MFAVSDVAVVAQTLIQVVGGAIVTIVLAYIARNAAKGVKAELKATAVEVKKVADGNAEVVKTALIVAAAEVKNGVMEAVKLQDEKIVEAVKLQDEKIANLLRGMA